VFGASTTPVDLSGVPVAVPLHYIGIKMRTEIVREAPATREGSQPPAPIVTAPIVTAEEVAARESDQFACAFLRASYMTCNGARTTHNDMYNNYLAACVRAGRKGMPSHLFPKCVK